MTNIPDKQEREDSKEIRLFGEKSIREEAYRQKIIQLEKDIMKLESEAKNKVQAAEKKPEQEINNKPPEYSEGLFYESLDDKADKHQRKLEERARYISDRLDRQSQEFFQREKLNNYLKHTKKIFVMLSVFTIAALSLAAFSVYKMTNLKATNGAQEESHVALGETTQRIRMLLQKNGFYSNQYTIISLNHYNKGYRGIVELHSKPHNDWTIKMIASDIIENFKSTLTDRSLELNFMYEGDTCAKVSFSNMLNQIRYEFLRNKR